ncbi:MULTISPECIES: putative quinol monooxygenase [Chromobacterium]|uniref:Antibiotic biosynthesis monooxygenase n=1 Tax=Chromobacterium haemolyticum TaxID=394935 RepID=A0ABS3GIB5_9NEIS|nr:MULTISPECIES: putative quinol monooxygenase [Chromobacterium]MBK0413673.1 antibiotic biosynthesis monooxygenase [Chromobacterium haemolyticum]MBO0414775.1 antibiotic biosynthesis monooxygenase [Chromobacterium haemolyticum]MBO0498036.1 antibiotic biosynthesis monooxygenase [Chromobacterium haemolyticum]MDH0342464.1 antibiotic biosynthesis monooxygenase [Chromobacterium haemolyticum]QOD81243.1 antibiotic biosynthesis monooxygenase [Chromobacterium haemolyticum]
MITLNVFFNVKAESQQDFLTLLNTMVRESNKEAGCNYYQLWQQAGEPLRYALIELWDSKERLAEHQKTPHWIAFNDRVNDYLDGQYDEHHYSELAR